MARTPLSVFLVAGEESGDRLAASLMAALRAATDRPIAFAGVGGGRCDAEGLEALFPMSDIAVMGMDAIVRRLPLLLRRIRETADAVVAARPDVLVIVDAPDFTHRVARRVRARAPDIPIVDYVSPTVWAWRPGRARAMARYVDLLLALLPFEPDVHARLGGPPCLYVGHPLLEAGLGPEAVAAAQAGRPSHVLVLPGSRHVEIERLMDPFGGALALMAERVPGLEATLPAVDHLADEIERRIAAWPVKPRVVRGDGDKLAAFASADAALACSGTVTLELALAGVPMAVAYRLDRFYRLVKQVNKLVPIAKVTSMVLPNIVLSDNVIPEFLDDQVTPTALADAVVPLIEGGLARERQVRAFERIAGLMALPEGETPGARAARAVLAVAERRPALAGG